MRKSFPLIILILAALKFALPFLLQHPAFELHRDEYLYYAQGQHLDFGFLENPPLIGLLGAISSLFGGTFFWIKFWPERSRCSLQHVWQKLWVVMCLHKWLPYWAFCFPPTCEIIFFSNPIFWRFFSGHWQRTTSSVT